MTKIPAQRRSFINEWDEISYRYDRLLYWLYERQNKHKAKPYAKRLEWLLNKIDKKQESIFGQEIRSLICETKGDLTGAIRHRENEIHSIRRLHDISKGTPSEAVALESYDIEDLQDRLTILAILRQEWKTPQSSNG